jgi:hypothetical protein
MCLQQNACADRLRMHPYGLSLIDSHPTQETVMLKMTMQELDTIREECRRIVRKKARWSGLASIIPVPLLDLAAEARLLSRLLPDITARFGLTPEKIRQMPTAQREKVQWHMRNRRPGFFGLVATRMLLRRSLQGQLGRVLTTQLAKFVPLTGTAVAGVMGYQVLRRIADQYIDDCYEVGRLVWQESAPSAPQAA